MSVFLTLCQVCSHRCTIGTIDTMEFEILNFGVFGLVWLGLHGNGAKNAKFIHQNTQKCNGLERTIYVPYFDRMACIINKNRSNGLERLPRYPPFCHVLAISSKMAEKCRGFDLSDCLQLDIH